MSFQKYKTNSYCVVGRHRSAATNVYVDMTSKGSILIIVPCSICHGKKSTFVTDNTEQAEGLGDFFKNLGEKGPKVTKRWQKKFKKLLDERWKSVLTMVVHLLLEALKKLYHHYQR